MATAENVKQPNFQTWSHLCTFCHWEAANPFELRDFSWVRAAVNIGGKQQWLLLLPMQSRQGKQAMADNWNKIRDCPKLYKQICHTQCHATKCNLVFYSSQAQKQGCSQKFVSEGDKTGGLVTEVPERGPGAQPWWGRRPQKPKTYMLITTAIMC